MTVLVNKKDKIIKAKKFDILLRKSERWLGIKYAVVRNRCCNDKYHYNYECLILVEILGRSSFGNFTVYARYIGVEEENAVPFGWYGSSNTLCNFLKPYRNTWILEGYRNLDRTLIKRFNVINTICRRALDDALTQILRKATQP